MTTDSSVSRRRATGLSAGLVVALAVWAAWTASGARDELVVDCPVWRVHHVVAPFHVDRVYRGTLRAGTAVWRRPSPWSPLPDHVFVDSAPLLPGGLAGVVESSCLAGTPAGGG